MGEILSLLASVSWAGSNVLTRRGVFHARESFSAIPITIGVGLIISFLALLVSGSGSKLAYLTWIGVLSLGGAGVVHFVIGRAFNYTSLRLIGANRTEPLLTSNIVFAIAFGMAFLGETLDLLQVLGIIAVMIGVVLIGTSAEGAVKGTKLARGVLLKGVGAGLMAGLCYGVSSLLIKVGLTEVGSGLAGNFISHVAAGMAAVFLVVGNESRARIGRLGRAAFIPMILGGAALVAGQIFRYAALGLVPISVVVPLTAPTAIFVPVFSFILNRKMEVFSPKVLGGAAMVIAGVYIILLVRF